MMGLVIKTLMRFECDHCGQKQPPGDVAAFERAEDAREAAEREGWVISDWLAAGCARQTAFCKSCIQKLADDAAKVIVYPPDDIPDTPKRVEP